ncbi:MAG: hypothetical protein ACOYD6_03580 [Limnochordia bacterium]|jgi:nucleotidyltransferase/DNA polymerase involved in DNA repair
MTMIIYLAGCDDALWAPWTQYTPSIERDEHGGFLDLKGCRGWEELLAQMPRYCQGSNKFVAKTACLWSTENLVPPGGEKAFLAPYGVETLWPLPSKIREGLKSYGLFTLGQISQTPRRELENYFGPLGAQIHALAWGIDPSPVQANYPPPLISCYWDWETPPRDRQELAYRLQFLGQRMSQRLQRANMVTQRLELQADRSYGVKIHPAQWQLEEIITYKLLPQIQSPCPPSLELRALKLIPHQGEQLRLFNHTERKTDILLKQLRAQLGTELIYLARELPRTRRQLVLQNFQNHLFVP